MAVRRIGPLALIWLVLGMLASAERGYFAGINSAADLVILVLTRPARPPDLPHRPQGCPVVHKAPREQASGEFLARRNSPLFLSLEGKGV